MSCALPLVISSPKGEHPARARVLMTGGGSRTASSAGCVCAGRCGVRAGVRAYSLLRHQATGYGYRLNAKWTAQENKGERIPE